MEGLSGGMSKKIKGLSENEVIASRKKHGDNSLQTEKRKTFLRRFFENLNDPIIKILIAALVVQLVFTFKNCNYFEVWGIVIAILLATTVSTISEFGSEQAFEKLQNNASDSIVRALREEKICEIPANELVVGDVVLLSSGEMIQADGVMINGKIRVDQSALNGESKEVDKSVGKEEKESWELFDETKVFRGSVIVSGEGMMRVCRVGGDSFYGMVARDVQTETRESPLKLRLSKFAAQISRIGYVMAIVVGISYLFNAFVSDNGFIPERILSSFKDIPFLIATLTHALTLMLTVVVVAAPEGLPMMITVVLSANMKKMMQDGVLVKKLVGIETAGSMNILFTDKTGTLTTGKLECEKILSIDGSYKNAGALKRNSLLYKYMILCAYYNTDSAISGGVVTGGNGTDRAFLNFFKNETVEKAEINDKMQFSSEKKYATVSIKNVGKIYKGAPEILLAKSNKMLKAGEITDIDAINLEKMYLAAANLGYRVIAICMEKQNCDDMIFIGFAVLKDRIRVGVRESVKGVKRAGVRVIMITGDGKETAAAIAKECGIITDKCDVVITSKELDLMSDDEVKAIIPNLAVLSRALPQDKMRLVRLSQECGFVVGMTGDGINDAPALKLADIGFSMGSGTDIAKSAGDVVLLDNSFLSINRTILYGRTIFKSIRKFITFQLIMNLTACGISLFGQFIGIDTPITIIQMLWVNIIMDTLGGLAFAGEPALERYMCEKPKTREEPILTKEMIYQILVCGCYTLLLCALFLRLDYFKNAFRNTDGDICFFTAFYALFIFCGIFNCIGARAERVWIFSNISKNKAFIFILLIISVVQIIMIYYGGTVFRTVPLKISELLRVLVLSSTVVPIELLRRIFARLNKSKRS